MIRTPEQINNEINALRTLKPTVPEFTHFGDNNHAAIDAQLDVLEGGLSEDDVYDIYGQPEDEDGQDFLDQNVLDAALDAARWVRGQDSSAPSSGWN